MRECHDHTKLKNHDTLNDILHSFTRLCNLRENYLKKNFWMNEPQHNSSSILKNLEDLDLVILTNCILLKEKRVCD